MKRSAIRKLGRFLPQGVRQAAKRHFLGQSIETVQARFALEKSGASIICRINDAFSFSAPRAGENDLAHYTRSFEGRAEFAALAKAAADPGGSLFDIGAHCGLISALWCAAKPDNRVFSFEPSPALSRRLAEIRDLNRFGERMQLNQIGIGEAEGATTMLMDPVGGFVQSRHFDNTMWGAPESIEVQIETIESASAARQVVPGFIKLDIEGYEYEAIKGSASFLARHRPVIFLELHLNYLEERKIAARSVVELLEEAGYSFFTYAGAAVKAAAIFDSPLGIYHVVAR
jgi:FkbM family methyltransferase